LPILALEQISVPIPCSVEWNSMTGDQQQRYCTQCRQQVYNLSAMTRDAAEEFIQAHSVAIAEGTANGQQPAARLCVRLYRRPDGTVVTRDCSRITQATRKTAAWIFGLAASLLFVMLGVVGLSRASGSSVRNPFGFWPELCTHEPLRTWFGRSASPPVIMGDIAPLIPSKPPQATASTPAQAAPTAE
jgi:hypothetical protein